MPPYEKPKTAYDFITAPPVVQKQSFFAKQSMSKRIGLVAGGGLALLIVVLLFSSLLSSGPSNKDTLLTIAQQQAELARVASLGTRDADQTTMNVAYSTSMVLTSDKAKLATALAANGVTFKDKQIAKGINAKTDQELTAARAASNFDDTFLQTIDAQLAQYQQLLSEAHANTGKDAVKTALADNYKHSELLRAQIKSTQL